MESNSTTSDTDRLSTKESKNVSIVTTNEDISGIFLEMCTELKIISKRIAEFEGSMGKTNQLLARIEEMNFRLTQDETRTKMIEELTDFLKKESSPIDYRKDVVNRAVGEVDSRMEESFRLLTKHATANIDEFQKALGKQQDALQQKLGDTQTIVDELKGLASLKDVLMQFENSISDQKEYIQEISDNIKLLTTNKKGIGMINVKIPKGIKLVLICLVILITIT